MIDHRTVLGKAVEVLVSVEHLDVFASVEGLNVFGTFCEALGRCCQCVAQGRQIGALRIATTISQTFSHVLLPGPDRTAVEDAWAEFLAVLAGRPSSGAH